jgi:hypothetical protein
MEDHPPVGPADDHHVVIGVGARPDQCDDRAAVGNVARDVAGTSEHGKRGPPVGLDRLDEDLGPDPGFSRRYQRSEVLGKDAYLSPVA